MLLPFLICLYLFSGAESAFFTLTPSDIESLKRDRNKSSDTVVDLLSVQDRLLSIIQTLIGIVIISVILIANAIIDKFVIFNDALFWELSFKFTLILFMLLFFGGTIPRSVAIHNPLRFSRLAAIPLMFMMQILKPLLYVIIGIEKRIGKGIAVKKMSISIDELSNVIEMTENQTSEEKKILAGIVKFVNTDVEKVMKSRLDVIALDIKSDFDEVKRVIIESGFSRIPIYEDSLDDIKGVLYVKDMLPYIGMSSTFEWWQFLRGVYFVPEHKKIEDLLKEFQSNKVHIAIVVDEYGSTLGLVSLEDILEEVVGEILDESDVEESFSYKMIDDDNYIFDGNTHLDEFGAVIGVEDDFFSEVEDGAETISGLMLEANQEFLYVGDSVKYKSLTLTAEVMDARRIDRVKVHIAR